MAASTPGDSPVLHDVTTDGIAIITINRPSVRNAVNRHTASCLAAAFRAFEADEAQRVCVFTGTGASFCAGYDLHEVAQSSAPTFKPPASPPDTLGVDGSPGPMGPTRMAFSKPVIAAISGPAVAGGLELALMADMRVADETAIFGVFCRRFGVPLIDGGTIRLARIIGLGRALDMVLTGRAVDSREALQFGLANRVVEKGKAVEEAMNLARDLLKFPQRCVNADRLSVYNATYDARSMLDALKFEYAGGEKVLLSESLAGAARFDRGEGRGGSFESKKSKL